MLQRDEILKVDETQLTVPWERGAALPKQLLHPIRVILRTIVLNEANSLHLSC